MFTKMLLATSALVVASSMALGSQHQAVPSAKVQRLMREGRSMSQPWLILSKDMIPIAVRRQPSRDQNGGTCNADKILNPGKWKFNTFSRCPNARVLIYFGWLAGKQSGHTSGPYSHCYQYSSGGACISGYKYSYVYNSTTRSAAEPFTGVAKVSEVQIYATASGADVGKIALHNNQTTGCLGAAPSCVGTAIPGASGTFPNRQIFSKCSFYCSALQTVTFPAVKLNKNNTYWVVVSGATGNGTFAWAAQDSNFTSDALGYMGEDFNETGSYTFHEHYFTAGGNNYTYNTPYNEGTGGWITTAAGVFGDPSGAFRLN